MLKIAVYDGGWGGETVASYLARELQTVEVIRVIDWENMPYENREITEINTLADNCLRGFIGKVDLIVIAGYMTSLAIEFLRNKYQEQKFVSVSINYYRILKASNYPKRITALMNQQLVESDFCQTLRNNLPLSTIAIPDSAGWEELSNYGELTANGLRAELSAYFQLSPAGSTPNVKLRNRSLLEIIREEKYHMQLATTTTEEIWEPSERIPSDVVLLLNTNFWDKKLLFEELFGVNVRVLDFREKLLHDVCIALNLLGVDGKRSK